MRILPPQCLLPFIIPQASNSGAGPMITLVPCFLHALLWKWSIQPQVCPVPSQPPRMHTVNGALLPSSQMALMIGHVCHLNHCRYSLHHAAAPHPQMVSTLVRLPHHIHTSKWTNDWLSNFFSAHIDRWPFSLHCEMAPIMVWAAHTTAITYHPLPQLLSIWSVLPLLPCSPMTSTRLTH